MTFVGYDVIMPFIVKVAFFTLVMYSVFMVFSIMATVSHRKPVPMGTSRDSSITQDNDKTKHTLYSCLVYHKLICLATGP